ncbi:4-alpha-glucanotransferase [sulfur-oxidizing endosymbiont of Gigantopelta aegis]|uniref:4-alpha-glucanotransferase n=1 Tax=sulfur-oxidizing endosymbiont of Gigantopelta aegis TaxID=2794934 RepID=UPI0018DC668E|nr:4-alpha-glucanotransferase [sulfur-oxidizing endosymbiont of Gigantopelta aegis]
MNCQYNQSAPLDTRRSGVLLHLTSLPGPYGQGVIGEDAYRFVDFLKATGFTVWQTLPLGPTHGDGSPYQSLSVHAGNPHFIDLQWLVERGWLAEYDLHHCFTDAPYTSKYGRSKCISIAFNHFHKQLESETDKSEESQHFYRFIQEQAFWLDDFALYCALKNEQQQKSWVDWPDTLKNREAEALNEARIRLKAQVLSYQFEQFLFFSQWASLKNYANEQGIYLFGDLPIFVAHDSADVWAQRQFFKLNEQGHSDVVAGVPPDYFSATGQRWGNPHYHWENIEKTNFSWWQARIQTQKSLFDLVRIDHFRGFEASWEIPAEEETAINGRWVKSPGEKLLTALYQAYPDLALVAEDLGIITDEVNELREKFNLPGMKILQFAFSGESSNPYLPHNHQLNSVVYTGTHDNDTTQAWLNTLNDDEKHYLQQYFNFPYEQLNQVLMNTAMASVAKLAIIPMQDLMGLAEGERMNTPGTTEGNWQWQFSWAQLDEETKNLGRQMNTLYGRLVS